MTPPALNRHSPASTSKPPIVWRRETTGFLSVNLATARTSSSPAFTTLKRQTPFANRGFGRPAPCTSFSTARSSLPCEVRTWVASAASLSGLCRQASGSHSRTGSSKPPCRPVGTKVRSVSRPVRIGQRGQVGFWFTRCAGSEKLEGCRPAILIMRWRWQPKSETRNPKPEGNPRAEGQFSQLTL